MSNVTQRNVEDHRPRIAITLGDVAGIGPELAVRAWSDPRLHEMCRPLIIGNAEVLRREIQKVRSLEPEGGNVLEGRLSDREKDGKEGVQEILSVTEPLTPNPSPRESEGSAQLLCLEGSSVAVADLEPGRVHAQAGRAAFDYLIRGIDLATEGSVDAIVTLPLNKQGLRAAGLPFPGHTEILAERTGTKNFGMMLFREGLGVLHVTLHLALRDVFACLRTDRVFEKIGLLETTMRRLGVSAPRLAVAALNPHAGDGGSFGDEEQRILVPAVERAIEQGIDVIGPLPVDTLFVRASGGEFDGVVAMYHDQGHIALKLLGWRQAVNITVGLPIVRTSVAHGTAYDIVGRGIADPTSLLEAIRIASLLRKNAAVGRIVLEGRKTDHGARSL